MAAISVIALAQVRRSPKFPVFGIYEQASRLLRQRNDTSDSLKTHS